ncbi:MAG: hypothetical protein N2449_09845 [Bacteroidales bacterium]|nr:hypothetical protein [Bacteroidales bacterium]
MNKYIFFLFLLLFSYSCTKYEDGPLFTFRSKNKRLCKTWKYEAIIYTDQGLTITTNLPKLKMTFNNDKTYSDNNGYTGEWRFKGDVELEITKNKQGDSTQTLLWEITRLSNKELWLRYNKVDHHFIAE